MAFSFANAGRPAFGSSGFGASSQPQGQSFGGGSTGANPSQGPDLEEIQTENIGFQALAGDAKVQLLPSAWPAGALPLPTASLLSIAQGKGLIAAAGPDSVVVASTEAVRTAFSTPGDDVKAFKPQLVLPIGMRVSQVAFSSDESWLAISAEQGGGLAVYDVQTLMEGKTQSAFEMSTDGVSIRALVPNPTPEKAEFFAIVNANGQLVIANMKTRQYVPGGNVKLLKEGVSCVSWSTKGKQLVAGLGDGSAYQMTPEGEAKADIPCPPGLEGQQHVSAISWLENNIFLVAHTPTNFDQGMAPATTYHIINRAPQNSYTFQKLPEVCGPFGLNRSPPFQFLQRLIRYPPHLTDAVIVSSTASGDVGLFTRASKPLTSDANAERTRDVFTTTAMANDSARAALPMTQDMSGDTSPIGMVLDLSSKTNVIKPLPDVDESPGPLPAIMILNNEGLLASWYIVYAEAVRSGTTYPGMVAASGQPAQVPQSTPPPFAAKTTQQTPAFGQSTFGALSTASPFGAATNATPAFGSTSTPGATTGAFGATTGLGNRPSPWGGVGASTSTTSAFGKPAFGAPSTFGAASAAPAFGSATPSGTQTSSFGAPSTPAFGSTSPFGGGGGAAFGSTGGLGQRASPWGQNASSNPTAPSTVFGQASKPFGSPSAPAPFGTTSTSTTGINKGFASFASSGGFAAAAAKTGSTSGNIFGAASPSTAFKDADMTSSFGTPQKVEAPAGGLFGSSGDFKLSSAWKNPKPEPNDESSRDDEPSSSLFGSDFRKTLTEPAVASPSKEEDMQSIGSEMTDDEQPKSKKAEAATPAKSQYLADLTTPSQPTGGLFTSQTPAKPSIFGQSNTPGPSLLGKPSIPLSTPVAMPAGEKEEKSQTPFGTTLKTRDAPLPPDTTSKTSYTPGNSSNSSAAVSNASSAAAPLPPDFLKSKPKPEVSKSPAEDAPLPPDFVTLPKTVATKSDDMPLPPDFLPGKFRQQTEEEPPLPAEEEEAEDFEEEESEEEDGGEEGEEGEQEESEEGEDGEEGSGIDVTHDMTSTTDGSFKVSPESSFGGQQEKSLPGGLFQTIKLPNKPIPKPLFGEVGKSPVPFFPTPKVQQSPRSPSPVRLHTGGFEANRSVSAPHVPTRGNLPRKSSVTKQGQLAVTKVPDQQRGKSLKEEQQELAERVLKARAQKKAEEEQDLSDGEDDYVHDLLTQDVEPSLELEGFRAHTDYSGQVAKPGIPGQIEKVYRDINSMIDNLGLNARSLTGFVKAHAKPNQTRWKRQHLEEESNVNNLTPVSEISSLVDFQQVLGDLLRDNMLEAYRDTSDSVASLKRDTMRLLSKQSEMEREINIRIGKDDMEAVKTNPLSSEQLMLQTEMRRHFATFQQTLGQLEEAISIVRAKLASHEAAVGGSSKNVKVPTVEAVERTILKMTGMVERKNSDIDFLESKLRKLQVIGSPVASREASPFMTPPQRKSGKGLPFTPGSSVNGGAFFTPKSTRSAFANSTTSNMEGGFLSPRKSIQDITTDEAQRYARKAKRRTEINSTLKKVFAANGMKVRKLDEA